MTEEDDTAAANALLDRICPILKGDPDVVAVVLAVLVARHIASYQLFGEITPADITKLQRKQLDEHIESVKIFIPMEVKALDDALARGEEIFTITNLTKSGKV